MSDSDTELQFGAFGNSHFGTGGNLSGDVLKEEQSTEKAKKVQDKCPEFESLKEEIKWITPHSFQLLGPDSIKLMSVRRKNLWMDGMNKISLFYPNDLQGSPFLVQFIGEAAADYGGPRREFFAQMMRLAESELLQGSDKKLTFQRDAIKLHARMFESYGKLLSLSFLYGYPGPKCFAPTLVSYILDHDIGSVEVNEIPDFEGWLQVARISKAKDDTELKESLATIDERFDAGLNKVQYTLDEKPSFVKGMVHHYVVSKQLEEIQQFKKRLELMSVLPVLQKHPSEACKEFIFTKLSSSSIINNFDPEYSSDKDKREKESDIVYNFNNFLDELEEDPQWNSFTAIVDLDSDKEEVTKLDLHDVLQFLCGSRHIPAGGLQGKMKFSHNAKQGKRVRVNACIIEITFPVTDRYMNSLSFNKNFGDDIICSPGFGQV